MLNLFQYLFLGKWIPIPSVDGRNDEVITGIYTALIIMLVHFGALN